MIDTKAFSSEALPDYYSRLAQRLEDCSCFRIALAKKAEAGSARSEKGYQMLPEIPPRMTAEEKAEILAGVDEFVRYYAFPEGLYRYVRSDGSDTKGEPQ